MSEFCFLFIVFIGMLDFRIPYGGYWDEGMTLFIGMLWLIQTMRKKGCIPLKMIGSFSLLFFLTLVGIAGNMLNPQWQDKYIAIIKDIFAFIKFPLLMIVLPQLVKNKKYNRNIMSQMAKIITICTCLIAIVGYAIDIGVYTEDKTRLLKSFEFYYQHCTFFVFSYVIVIAVLMRDSIEKNKIYILLNCILLFMTQRSKAYFAIAIVLGIMIVGEKRIQKFFQYTKRGLTFNKKTLFFGIMVIALIGYLIVKDRVVYHWQYGLSAARPALYITGLKLLKDYFPLGSGFGTFASFVSGENYSKIYYQYGISGTYGLSPDNYSYVSDTFWPYIYGQLGVLGLIGYIILIISLFRSQMSKIKEYNTLMAFLLIWLYALLASTAEAFFTNTTGIQMALAMTLLIEKEGKKCQ